MQTLKAENLTETYGTKTLFDHINFLINAHDRIGLIGTNGTGKTSLLNVLANIDPQDSGEIETPKNYTVGYLRQTPTLDDNMTIMDAVFARNGKLFYSYVNDSLNLLDRGISSVSGGIQTSEQQISILFEVASTLIPKIVNRIQQNLPNVRLNIAQHVQMDTDLQQYDFVVTTRKIPNYFTAQIIKEEVFVGWKSNYPNGTVKASTLTNTQFIGLGNHNQLRKTIDDYFHEQKLTINFKYETDDPATVRGLIDAGVGIGFIPAVTWKTAGKSLHLARLTPDIMSRTIYLCSSTHELNDIQREISNELIETFADAQKEQLTL